jgi:hypothetical protein
MEIGLAESLETACRDDPMQPGSKVQEGIMDDWAKLNSQTPVERKDTTDDQDFYDEDLEEEDFRDEDEDENDGGSD